MSTALKAQAQDWFPTRYSLLSRLQDWDDQESWKDFFNTYWRLIYSVALKSGLTGQEAQDVVQETVICVAKNIHTFKRDRTLGSFKSWLGNIIRWRIIDELRKREPTAPFRIYRDPADEDADPLGVQELPDPAYVDPETIWDEEWQTNLFDAAVERVKQQVREEHYQIFYLYTFKQWPAGKVADALGVSIAQVYLVKHRISTLIKKEVRSLEKKLF